MSGLLPRAELVTLVARIMSGDYSSDTALDDDLRRLRAAVVHPGVTDLIFWDERHLTPEQVVDEALAYKPIAL